MTDGAPAYVAVDWGTTRLRASLVAGDGLVLDRRQADTGVQSVLPGGFPAALEAACGSWFAAAEAAGSPALSVIMAGMVGSRNGWREAPYAPCPAGISEIAARMTPVPGQGRDIAIVPGVDCRWADGAYDVMRGEETQALGTGVATFVTGELFAAVSASFMARLAEEPDDVAAGAVLAAATARSPGGLTRQLFQARARVLGGDLSPRGVRPYLSRLLVEAEIAGALDLFGRPGTVHLVAGEPQLGIYRAALAERGLAVEIHDVAAVTLAGLTMLMNARTVP